MKIDYGKIGEVLNQVVLQIIIIALVFSIFFFATSEKVNGRDVKQQVLEKQIALLIDSAIPGMTFEINKLNFNGEIQNIEIRNGRVYVSVDGISSSRGYPYFSKYDVNVTPRIGFSFESDGFLIKVGEKNE